MRFMQGELHAVVAQNFCCTWQRCAMSTALHAIFASNCFTRCPHHGLERNTRAHEVGVGAHHHNAICGVDIDNKTLLFGFV